MANGSTRRAAGSARRAAGSARRAAGSAAGQTGDLLPFQRVQLDFAAHIRDPDGVACPLGIEPRRMAIYARLFYNNVEQLLARVFSTLRSIVGSEAWTLLVRDFLRRHRAESPFYSALPEEFLQYLTDRTDGPAVPTFAVELCHYQWVKYALPLAPDIVAGTLDDLPIGSDDPVVLSALAFPLRYAFPVTDLGVDCQPSQPPAEATHLIVYRNRRDEVGLMASNAVTIRLLQLIGQGLAIRRCFSALASELEIPMARIEESGLAILNRLRQQDIVVRTQGSPDR